MCELHIFFCNTAATVLTWEKCQNTEQKQLFSKCHVTVLHVANDLKLIINPCTCGIVLLLYLYRYIEHCLVRCRNLRVVGSGMVVQRSQHRTPDWEVPGLIWPLHFPITTLDK